MSNVSSEANHSSRRVWPGIAGAVVIFIGAQLLASFLISLYPYLSGWSSLRAQAWLSNSLAAQVGYLAIANGLIFIGLYYFFRWRHISWASIGFKRPSWLDPIYSLLALPVYVIAFALLAAAVKALVPALNLNQAQDLGFNGSYHGLQLALVAIALVVIPPITEETIFRGLIYTSLRHRFRYWPAAIITSLLFAAGHLPEGGSGGLLYIAALDTFVLSLILVYLRERTGRLWASMGLHALKNGIAFISLFIVHVR